MVEEYFALYEHNKLKAIFYFSDSSVWWKNTIPSTLELKIINKEDFERLDKQIEDES